MSLAKRLDNMRRASAERIDAASRAVMHDATEALRATGIVDRAIQENGRAPAFDLHNSRGESISSAVLLGQGPVVLTFFRGHW